MTGRRDCCLNNGCWATCYIDGHLSGRLPSSMKGGLAPLPVSQRNWEVEVQNNIMSPGSRVGVYTSSY